MAKKKKSGDDEEKKGGKMKPIVIALVALALVYQFVLKKPAPEAKAGEKAAAEQVVEEGEIVKLKDVLDDDLTINLAGPGKHYLRAGLAVVLEKGVSAEAIEPELALVADVAIDVFGAETYEHLRDPATRVAIKKELSEKVRKAFHDEKVVRIIFTQFVMQ